MMKDKEPTPHVKKIIDTKIELSGAYLHNYKVHFGYLIEALKQLDASEIMKLQNLAANEAIINSSSQKCKSYHELAIVLTRVVMLIAEVKTRGTLPEYILEDLAKHQLFLFAEANSVEDPRFDKVKNALYQLATAIDNLSQGKFPDAYKRQETKRGEAIKKEIEAKRDELKKINVR